MIWENEEALRYTRSITFTFHCTFQTLALRPNEFPARFTSNYTRQSNRIMLISMRLNQTSGPSNCFRCQKLSTSLRDICVVSLCARYCLGFMFIHLMSHHCLFFLCSLYTSNALDTQSVIAKKENMSIASEMFRLSERLFVISSHSPINVCTVSNFGEKIVFRCH